MAANIRRIIMMEDISVICHKEKIFQCPIFKVKAIEIKIKTSPIRLVKAVIMPAPRDLGLW